MYTSARFVLANWLTSLDSLSAAQMSGLMCRFFMDNRQVCSRVEDRFFRCNLTRISVSKPNAEIGGQTTAFPSVAALLIQSIGRGRYTNAWTNEPDLLFLALLFFQLLQFFLHQQHLLFRR